MTVKELILILEKINPKFKVQIRFEYDEDSGKVGEIEQAILESYLVHNGWGGDLDSIVLSTGSQWKRKRSNKNARRSH